MTNEILVVADHQKGVLADTTYEMLGAGQTLAASLNVPVSAALVGSGVEALAGSLGAAKVVLSVDHETLAVPGPDAIVEALMGLVGQRQPSFILLAGTNSFVGVGAKLSHRLQRPFINFCRDLRVENGVVVATCQLFGGKVHAEIEIPVTGAVISICPGCFAADAGRKEGAPPVEKFSASVPEHAATFRRFLEATTADIDITKQDVLVAVGRGIDSAENLEMAEELATLLGGAVCGSRPVIDQGWLPLSRQVGKSGMSVKPRLYLALGISGAPEHLEGMKQSGFILSINRDASAPIFDVSHAGVCGDIFDVLPPLISALKARKGG